MRLAGGWWIYKTILLVHRLACVVFLAVVGHFAMVAVDDFGLHGGEPRKDSTAGTKREYMTMKRDGIVLMRRMREDGLFAEFLDEDLRESIDEDKMAVRIWAVVEGGKERRCDNQRAAQLERLVSLCRDSAARTGFPGSWGERRLPVRVGETETEGVRFAFEDER